MPGINLCNSSGRDAVVNATGVRPHSTVRWLDEQGRQAHSARILKATLAQDLRVLQAQFGSLNSVAEALIEGDPEIDVEQTGRLLSGTSRVYVNADGKLVHRVKFFENIHDPDGTLRERRPRRLVDPNMSSDQALRWSGIFIEKREACRRFVFTHKLQVQHINGLTYDFLYAMAKELEDRQSLMVLGGGPKSNQPLVLRRGGSPYRGFLEGRTNGEQYRLVLHFSNLELKVPTLSTDSSETSRTDEEPNA